MNQRASVELLIIIIVVIILIMRFYIQKKHFIMHFHIQEGQIFGVIKNVKALISNFDRSFQ